MRPAGKARLVALLLVSITVIASTGAAQFQRGGGRFVFGQIRPNPSYDGAWMFCRIMFRNASNGDGGGWAVDYPRADQNLSFRLSELTRTPVSNDGAGNFNHAVLQLTDAATLSLARRDGLIPTLMVVDDTFTAYRDQMAAVIAQAKAWGLP